MDKAVFTDSHCHLYVEDFEDDRKEVIERAIEKGVTRMYLPSIDSRTTQSLIQVCQAFPENCFPMMGLHPTSVKANYKEELDFVEKNLRENSYAAIGEIGIDLYWTKAMAAQQEEVFIKQLEWAMELDLPVVIHSRESYREIFMIMDRVWKPGLKGVFHSFTGTFWEAEKIQKYDFLIGLNGIVTFKNSGMDKTIAGIDPEKILLETDAPYLAPTPYRGKRNESSYLTLVAEKIAGIHKMDLSELAEITTQNALSLFKLG